MSKGTKALALELTNLMVYIYEAIPIVGMAGTILSRIGEMAFKIRLYRREAMRRFNVLFKSIESNLKFCSLNEKIGFG